MTGTNLLLLFARHQVSHPHQRQQQPMSWWLSHLIVRNAGEAPPMAKFIGCTLI
jgi:hypothetical protein